MGNLFMHFWKKGSTITILGKKTFTECCQKKSYRIKKIDEPGCFVDLLEGPKTQRKKKKQKSVIAVENGTVLGLADIRCKRWD